jgi:uncharacterized repeat protein (TIGR01451 family)
MSFFLRPRRDRRWTRLRFEALEARRLLAATDVTLHVLTANGDAELVFNGTQQISGYEIDSPGGQLLPANWHSLASQGNSGWATLGSTHNTIAEGNLSGSLSTSTTIDLGQIFSPGGTQDLTFKWSDANNNAFVPAVVYVSPPDLTISKIHSGSFQQGDTADTYTITVNNIGAGPTAGTVTVTDTLPAGLTPTAATGSGWSAQINGGTVTATRNDALAAGTSYPALTLTVSVANNAASVTNTAAVSGGGETNTANDTASDPTTITVPAADLTIGKSHLGNFSQGDAADNYTITVSNVGSLPTSGPVTVTDIVPAGMSAVTASGAGWSTQVTGATITATRSDALAAGASYPTLTIVVGVAADAPASISNAATVAGGGELNLANDTATDATTIIPVADLTVSKSHSGTFHQGDAADTYTVTVHNIGGGATSGDAVNVTDVLPAGLTATAAAGTGWTTQINGSTVTATRSDILAAGGSYPALTITVSVANTAAASVTNTVSVDGGGEAITTNDTASDPTTIVPAADLTIAKSHTGNFRQGETGDTYSIAVTNSGAGASTGTVTVTDTLPTGLTPTAADGSGWTTHINGSTVTATRSDGLSAGANYPTLTITVNVANNAVASLTNTATVAGGGEVNTANDSASDATTILPMPDLTIAKTHANAFRQGDTGDSYTLAVANAGAGPTSGQVTVTDTLPAGLAPTAASGSGWTTQISGSTVTATRSDALAAGASFPALTVTVSVAASAANSVTNTATVAGGGEINTTNDSASDVTAIAAAQNSLAGYVYVDTANNGQRFTSQNAAKPALAGVTVKLLSQDAQGNWVEASGTTPVKTGTNGSYHFASLPAGSYRIQVAPPGSFVDGQDTAGQIAGSTRGTVTQDQIEVQLNGSENGTEYNFAMQGLRPSVISNRLFLASTPAADKLYSQFVSSTTPASVSASRLQATSAAPKARAAAAAITLASNSKPSAAGVDALMARRPFLLLASERP